MLLCFSRVNDEIRAAPPAHSGTVAQWACFAWQQADGTGLMCRLLSILPRCAVTAVPAGLARGDIILAAPSPQTLSNCGDAIRFEAQPGGDINACLDNTLWFDKIVNSRIGKMLVGGGTCQERQQCGTVGHGGAKQDDHVGKP